MSKSRVPCKSKSCVHYEIMRKILNSSHSGEDLLVPCLTCKRYWHDNYEYDMDSKYSINRRMRRNYSMSELRIVKQDAVSYHINDAPNNWISKRDTIPVSSLWTDKEAVELLGADLGKVGDLWRPYSRVLSDTYKPLGVFIYELITLSIKFKESGLSKEDYLKQCKDFTI